MESGRSTILDEVENELLTMVDDDVIRRAKMCQGHYSSLCKSAAKSGTH